MYDNSSEIRHQRQHKTTLCNSDKDGNAGLAIYTCILGVWMAWHRVEPASSMFHVNYTSNMRKFLYTASITISPSVLCYPTLFYLNSFKSIHPLNVDVYNTNTL